MASGGGRRRRRYKEECWEPDAMDESDVDEDGEDVPDDVVANGGGYPRSTDTTDDGSTRNADDYDGDDEGVGEREEEGRYDDNQPDPRTVDWGLRLDPASVPRAPMTMATMNFNNTNAFTFPQPTVSTSFSPPPFLQQAQTVDTLFANLRISGDQQPNQNAGNFAPGTPPQSVNQNGSSETIAGRGRHSRSRSRSPNYVQPFIPYRRPKRLRFNRNPPSSPSL